MMEAARGGHVSTTLTLILLGANVNEMDDEGSTALMAAAENNQAPVIKALYDFESTLNAIRGKVRDAGEADGSLAMKADELEVLPKLIPKGNPPEKPDALALLKERLSGVDVRVFDEMGARLPEIEIVTNAQDKKGETALMKAAARGHIEAARELRAWQEENAQDHEGRTAAMHAARNGQADFVKALLIITGRWKPAGRGPICGIETAAGFMLPWAMTPRRRPICRKPNAAKNSN